MREIEVKYRVYDLAALERELVARGAVFSQPVRQDDQAYAPRDWAFGQLKTGVTFARLRSEDGRCVFTVKRPLDNEMACVEHETVVADRGQMHQAVIAMGFVPTVRSSRPANPPGWVTSRCASMRWSTRACSSRSSRFWLPPTVARWLCKASLTGRALAGHAARAGDRTYDSLVVGVLAG